MQHAHEPSGKLIPASRSEGVRMTRQRRAVLRALEAAVDHPDAGELSRRARRLDPTVSLSSVYRALGALERTGLVLRHSFSDGAARFEAAACPWAWAPHRCRDW